MAIEELFQRFAFVDIIAILTLTGLAIKELITFFDWVKQRTKGPVEKELTRNQAMAKAEDKMEQLSCRQEECEQKLNDIYKLVQILIDSDKDDIKAWITEKHHFYCYQLGYIDDFSLDCIEKRYGHYQDENGNSFVGDMMKDIRALPRVSNISNVENK